MRFGSTEIPGSVFQLARERILADATVTPEAIRQHLLSQAHETLRAISPIATNQRIIADRVMRDCLKQLVASGEIAQLKHGVWAKTTFLAAANGTSSRAPQSKDTDWSQPTTWMERFQGALTRMCGATPPEDLCLEWMQKVSVEGVDRLQEWVLAQPGTPAWAQGIATIEAAILWADQPTEGVAHEYRD